MSKSTFKRSKENLQWKAQLLARAQEVYFALDSGEMDRFSHLLKKSRDGMWPQVGLQCSYEENGAQYSINSINQDVPFANSTVGSYSFLGIAAQKGDVLAAKLLLEHKADPAKDFVKRNSRNGIITPAQLGLMYGRSTMLELFRHHGVNPLSITLDSERKEGITLFALLQRQHRKKHSGPCGVYLEAMQFIQDMDMPRTKAILQKMNFLKGETEVRILDSIMGLVEMEKTLSTAGQAENEKYRQAYTDFVIEVSAAERTGSKGKESSRAH